MATLGVGEHTLNDILDAFVAPNRDPRDEVAAPLLRSDYEIAVYCGLVFFYIGVLIRTCT